MARNVRGGGFGDGGAAPMTSGAAPARGISPTGSVTGALPPPNTVPVASAGSGGMTGEITGALPPPNLIPIGGPGGGGEVGGDLPPPNLIPFGPGPASGGRGGGFAARGLMRRVPTGGLGFSMLGGPGVRRGDTGGLPPGATPGTPGYGGLGTTSSGIQAPPGPDPAQRERVLALLQSMGFGF